MALRDHSLDGRITAAAREEFLDKSYTGASLRKIAEKAGVTVGAIQTRCKTKDALFCSLLQPLLADIGGAVSKHPGGLCRGVGGGPAVGAPGLYGAGIGGHPAADL